MAISVATTKALAYLKSVKPHDGWAVENHATRGVRLLRRSVPVSDTWFQNLALSQQNCVVGIVATISPELSRALVLVEPNGIPCRWPRNLMIQTTNTAPKRKKNTDTSTSASNTDVLSPEESIKMLMYGIYSVLAMMVLKLFISAAFAVYLMLFPAVYFYAMSTCPTMESFDAKQQLKRVLRGHDLPDDHPDKPKGFINRTIAKVNATVTTELAMSTGYEVTMWNIIGACNVATVRLPATSTEVVWVGAFGKWRFLMQREIPTNKYD